MRLVVKLRKGVMFPEKPGVMASRELVADDVIFTQNRMATSPKQVGDLYSFIDKTTARDKYTLVYDLKDYVADWDLRLGYGLHGSGDAQGGRRRGRLELEERKRQRAVQADRLRFGQFAHL